MRPTATLILLLFVAATDVLAQPAPAYRIEPPEPWVIESAIPESRAASTPDAMAASESLLRDDQILVSTATERYSRRVIRIQSTAGIQNWQEIEIDFDPTFQELVLHHVRIRRAGEIIDALRPDEVRIIQRETDLAQRIYDGRMTALLFIHDLRPGDAIDYAWSISGSNPILGGRFADLSMLSGGDPTTRLRWRLVHPADRPLQTKVYDSDAVVISRSLPDGMIERSIVLESLPSLVIEEQLPSWINPIPRVQTSDFGSWNDVSRWASTLFSEAMRGNDADALERTVKMIRGRGANSQQRATAAVRFVQDEIRYLGIEAGPNSHTPHPPSLVLSRRFGDCKDKALLLVQILEKLGFEARMALVDSGGGRELEDALPSPFHFDHVIVLVREAGREAWIDATVSDTGGSLWNLAPPPFDTALVADPDTTALARLPERDQTSTTHVVEKWTLESDGGATFVVDSRYEGGDADEIRAFFSAVSREELGEQYRDYYAQVDPEIEPASLPTIEDDRNANVVRVHESYAVGTFWSADQRELWAHVIGNRLLVPTSRKRTLPLALPSGSRAVHEIEIAGADDLSFAKFDRTVESEAFLLRARSWKDGDRFRFRWSWEPRADAVDPSKLAQYSSAAADADELLNVTISRGALALAGLGSVTSAMPGVLAGGAATATGVLLIGGVALQRFRRRRRRRTPGVASTREIATLPAARHCGVEGIVVGATGQTVGQQPDGSPLVKIAIVCPRCQRSRSLTVAIEVRPQPAGGNPEVQSHVNRSE